MFQTYETKSCGIEAMLPTLQLLDLTAYGRQETWEDLPVGWPQDKAGSWWRRDAADCEVDAYGRGGQVEASRRSALRGQTQATILPRLHALDVMNVATVNCDAYLRAIDAPVVVPSVDLRPLVLPFGRLSW